LDVSGGKKKDVGAMFKSREWGVGWGTPSLWGKTAVANPGKQGLDLYALKWASVNN